jgi:PAS domain S-box-containing protein
MPIKKSMNGNAYKAVFDLSMDALLVVDGVSRTVVEASDAVSALLGYEKLEVIGKSFSDLFLQDSPEPLAVYGSVVSGEFRRKDGSTAVLDQTAALIPWAEDQAILVTLRDASDRIRAEREREKLIRELEDALEKIKSLRGLLPICAHCKKIRDDRGYWERVETYIEAHSLAEFSHGICPECARKYYPEVFKK